MTTVFEAEVTCAVCGREQRNSAPSDARHVASRAYRYCQAGLTLPDLPPFMKRLLLFERQLAVECDTACHTVAEAQSEPDAGDGAASAETLH